MFCSACLANIPSCPLCRGKLDKSEISPGVPLLIRKQLNELKVYCPVDRTHKITRREYREHIEKAGHRCPNGCTVTLLISDMKNHNDVCPKLFARCEAYEFCSFQGNKKLLSEHIIACKFIPVLPQLILVRKKYEEQIQALQEENLQLRKQLGRTSPPQWEQDSRDPQPKDPCKQQ